MQNDEAYVILESVIRIAIGEQKINLEDISIWIVRYRNRHMNVDKIDKHLKKILKEEGIVNEGLHDVLYSYIDKHIDDDLPLLPYNNYKDGDFVETNFPVYRKGHIEKTAWSFVKDFWLFRVSGYPDLLGGRQLRVITPRA